MNRQIEQWAKIIKDSFSQLDESRTPHDEESIRNSFSHDISGEKMYPTQEFLEKTYEIMNKEFFEGKLPEQIIFIIASRPRATYVGLASYVVNNFLRTITPTAITLNSSRTLTLHEWLEVVLHEMIHVCDYVENPNHFMGYMRGYYDSHGYWFLNKGKEFEEYGFHVEKYCKADVGINTDDNRVKNSIKNSTFIVLNGINNEKRTDGVILVSDNGVEKTISYISDGLKRGRYNGPVSITKMKSENPNVSRLKHVRMKDSRSSLSYYYFDDDFKEKYGPFREIERQDMKDRVNEDRDETEYDEMNRIDDEHVRKMYDNISNVVDVVKKDKDTYEVSIA